MLRIASRHTSVGMSVGKLPFSELTDQREVGSEIGNVRGINSEGALRPSQMSVGLVRTEALRRSATNCLRTHERGTERGTAAPFGTYRPKGGVFRIGLRA